MEVSTTYFTIALGTKLPSEEGDQASATPGYTLSVAVHGLGV